MVSARSNRGAIVLALALLVAACTREALALPPRSPQVLFNSGALQAWMDAADGGISVLTDQLDAQAFALHDLGCADGRLRITLEEGGGIDTGFYDTRSGDPPVRYTLFPAAMARGSSCLVRLTPAGLLTIGVFDPLGLFQGSTGIIGVPQDGLGLDAMSAGGAWYSEDGRNGGTPHVLAFAGTGPNAGELFLCVEPGAVGAGSPGTFTGVILRCQAPTDCGATPARSSTWGGLKSGYR